VIRRRAVLPALGLLLNAAAAAAQDAPALENPVACPPGLGCMVRSFVDLDPGPEARDHRCGPLTYDTHRGVDIRVPDSTRLMQGVEVRTAAAGEVVGVRDEMPDISKNEIDPKLIESRAGGNAVVIDHGGGWVGNYWHLRRGSVRVKKGDRVAAGQPLGLIGLSGDTEFLHLHFELRHNGDVVDPFTGRPASAGCGIEGRPLWTAAALAELPYRTEAAFDAGFATGPVDFGAARAGAYAAESLKTDAPALVFWVEALGPQAGDAETIRLIGPDGAPVVDSTETIAETFIQRSRFAGARRPPAGWPPGTYRGEYVVRRTESGATRIVVEIAREIELR
jgi:murein DD-endopeptidase MepM/ murein hydrolase activator NlpD